jgi:hypothetical protein
MKHAILAALALTTLATTAHADPQLPAYAALPQGSLSAPPSTKIPAHIAATEKVPGFYVTVPNMNMKVRAAMKRTSVPRFAQVFASEDHAKGGNRNSDTCFAEDPTERVSKRKIDPMPSEDAEPRAWSNLQQMLTFPISRDMGVPVGVHAVHSERIVTSGDFASLESADVWVDPETKGVRLIGRASTPLRLLGAVPKGPRVWAMREGDDKLHVFVTQDPEILTRGDGLVSVSARGTDQASSCSHLRVTLKVEKGGADAVSILGTADLPALERGDGRGAKGASELRIRPVRVHTSVTWTSHDTAPVMTLSFGWEARTRTQPGPEPESD